MSDYSEILSRRHPSVIFVIRGDTSVYANITVISGVLPSEATLDAEWPSVQTEINLEGGTLLKERDFQSTYRIQAQLINIMQAVKNNDMTKINEMLSLWEVINNG